MRRVFALLSIFVLVLNCTASDVFSGLKSRQHAAMHWIILDDGEQKAGCTANAIGPHALLTAQHCDLPGATIRIDGLPPQPIVLKEYDGHDHMILIVPSVQFTAKIEYHPKAPRIGESVYFWGNPRGLQDWYREGISIGQVDFSDEDQVVNDGTPVDTFALTTQPGDSGSAIFNADGDLVGIVTYGIFNGMFAGSYQLNFTKDQIAAAKVK